MNRHQAITDRVRAKLIKAYNMGPEGLKWIRNEYEAPVYLTSISSANKVSYTDVQKKFFGEKITETSDTGGITSWPPDVANDLFLEEYMKEPVHPIAELYYMILGRDYDQEGLEYWTDRMEEGMTIEEIASHFYNSEEYKGKK